MNVAIVGINSTGIAIAQNFISRDWPVILTALNPSSTKYKNLTDRFGDMATVKSLNEAIKLADIFIYASSWEEAKKTCEVLNNATGKILIDASTPIRSGLQLDHTDGLSGAEQIAAWAPNLKVFKTLNHTGPETLRDPLFPQGVPVMFLAGPDGDGKVKVNDLLISIGFDPVDAGPLKNAKLLEQLALFWLHLAHLQDKGHNFAFSLLKR